MPQPAGNASRNLTAIEAKQVVTNQPPSAKSVKTQKGKEIQVKSTLDAVKTVNNEFGSWGAPAKLLFFGHAAWLLKDMFWILLISPAAYASAALCTLLLVASFALRATGGAVAAFYEEANAEMVISVMQLFWQLINFLYMAVCFVWEYPEPTPAYAEPFTYTSKCKDCKLYSCTEDERKCFETYDALITLVRVAFGVDFGIWIVFSVFFLYQWLKPPMFEFQGYALQTCCLQGGWVAWWIAKDVFWSLDDPGRPWAIAAWSIHFILLIVWLATSSSQIVVFDGIDAEELEKFAGAASAVFDGVSLSYVLWSISSLLWFIQEEYIEDDNILRYVAAGLCGAACLLYLSSYSHVRAKAQANDLFIRKLREEADAAPEAQQAWQDEAEVIGNLIEKDAKNGNP